MSRVNFDLGGESKGEGGAGPEGNPATEASANAKAEVNATPAEDPAERSRQDRDDVKFAKKKEKVRFVHCHDCGEDVPIDEWPNHRDRLRKVVIKERLSSIQRYIKSLIVDLFMWLLVNVYFREVDVCGLENVPKEGPVVFYGNHQNQFIDAMMIRAFCGRPVRFIIAEKSVRRPVIGHFARLMDSVPVVRPADVGSVQGQGKLVGTAGNVVTGEGTNFASTVSRGDVISWNVPGKGDRCSGQVLSIASDTELTLTLPVKEDDDITVPCTFKTSRRIDHSEMYASVYDTLAKGHCIGIFPEGGSHDRTSLQPLKAGVALFTLGAVDRAIFPHIIPCGLTYFYGHKFRSRAHIEFGAPVRPTDEMIENFRENDKKRKATGDFLTILDRALRSVTINVPDWATLKFLHAFRRLYQPLGVQLDTRDYLQLTRRLSIMIKENDDDQLFGDFRSKVENYMDYCSALLVRDSQAATLENLEEASVTLLVRRVMLLVVMGVVLTPFFFIAAPIGLLTHFAAEAHAKTALSASSVKVVAADVKGSYKLVVGFLVVPLVMNLVAFSVLMLSDFRTAATVFFSLPMAMYVSLLILQEFVLELYAAMPLLMSIFSKHKQFRKLFERRQALVAAAKEIVSRFDPTLETELAQLLDDDNIDVRQPSLFSLRHSSRKPQAKHL